MKVKSLFIIISLACQVLLNGQQINFADQQQISFNSSFRKHTYSNDITSVVIRKKNNEPSFPYHLDIKKDIAIGIGGLAVAVPAYAIGPINKLTPEQADALSPNDVNSFDRFAISQTSKEAGIASDILQYTCVGSGVLSTLLFSKFKLKEWGTLSVMFAEAFVWNVGITYSFKNYMSRPRPYVYRDGENGGGGDSDFQSHISGHTSTAFMCAVFVSKTYSDIFPESKAKWAVWTISLSAATATGLLRVFSGSHFPTDVIHGAFWGSVVGYFIPVLHRKPIFLGKKKKAQLKLSPFGMENYYGVTARINL